MRNLEFFGTNPAIQAEVFRTSNGTPYLKEPGVVMIAKPDVDLSGLQPFLDGFDLVDPSLGFGSYLLDPIDLPSGEMLCKTAGQLCYLSFGEKRTWNKDADRYFLGDKDNPQRGVIPQGHGSVLEHAVFVLLFYGLSRSQTHELVRHRAGCGFSQVSQRYVDGRKLRFVERPEYQNDPELHRLFLERIDSLADEYETVANILLTRQSSGSTILSGDAKTDLKKKVQQAARSVLPNEAEAPIVMSGNVRAWRHVISARANEHAETEIRELIFRAFLCLKQVAPILFSDFEHVRLKDGTDAVRTPYPKV